MYNLSFYGSHNATIALEKDGTILEVIEIERLLNRKNQGIAQYMVAHSREELVNYIKDYLYTKYNIDVINTVIYQNTHTNHNDKLYCFHEYFPAHNYIEAKHHESHAAGSLYQSDHKKALIVSFDGGGNDGWFKIFLAEKGKELETLEIVDKNFGVCYSMFGMICPQIMDEFYGIQGNLTYPGKLMGLAGYGNIRQEWVEEFTNWYNLTAYNSTPKKFKSILDKLDIKLNGKNQVSESDGQDLAATNQFVFESVFMSIVKKYLDQYPNLPLHLTGGSALNVLLNTKLSQIREVFVSPNPSDCGLAVGMLLNNIKPDEPVDLTYSGIEVLDKLTLPSIIEDRQCIEYSHDKMVDFIKEGKIIGVIRGKSEHGPRALGNRSILCDPAIPDMKDILNNKVKHREFYRPFAPVVRLQDVNKYFEWDKESRWMSFCPKVREEFLDKLPSIVHIDKTARVQTVTEGQNKWLYDLLTSLHNKTGMGVLLNTSFNQQGKPLVSTYNQGLQVLDSSQMDLVLLENYFIW